MYFQGLVPPGLLHPEDSSKNFTRAFGLWRYSASKGDPEAQFKIGLTLSTFYNPPSFSFDPNKLSKLLKLRSINSFNQSISFEFSELPHLDAFQSNFLPSPSFSSWKDLNSFINDLTSDLIHATELLIHTMNVLDLEDDDLEFDLVESWIQRQKKHHQIFLTSFHPNQSNIYPNESLMESAYHSSVDSSNNSTSIASLLTQETQLKRFPLFKRESQAFLYLYSAAQGGHVGAKLALGFRHLYGLGVPRRCTVGASYYLHVAREVAEISAVGIPPVAEVVRLDLDSIAAEEGHTGASGRTTGMRMQSHVSDLQRHLADTGHPKTQTAVGKKYLLGIDGCEQNYSVAIYYFKQAALRGYVEALSWLGYLVSLGIGVERDYDLAMKLFLLVVSSPQTQYDPMGMDTFSILNFIDVFSIVCF